MLLERIDRPITLLESCNSLSHSKCSGNSRGVRNILEQSGAANFVGIGVSLFPEAGIDDEMNCTVFYVIYHVRPSFSDLEDSFSENVMISQIIGCALCCDNLKAEIAKSSGNFYHLGFVSVMDTDKDRPF